MNQMTFFTENATIKKKRKRWMEWLQLWSMVQYSYKYRLGCRKCWFLSMVFIYKRKRQFMGFCILQCLSNYFSSGHFTSL